MDGPFSDQTVYDFGDFRLDSARHQLLLKSSGRALPLTAKAFETLLVLVQRRGQLVDKDALMKAVWPDVVVEENNLVQSISALRRVLGDTRDEHRYIVTLPGRGYRFVAGVTVVVDGAAGPAQPAIPSPNGGSQAISLSSNPSSEPAAPSSEALQPAPAVARPATRMRWLAGAAAVLLVAAGAIWLVRRNGVVSDAPPVPAARSVPTRDAAASSPRLAVLPFVNLSPDPANAFFADGLHEEILSELSQRLANVAVISRTTMMSYQQTPKPLRTVAQELGATHVIEGTVRREGDRVRLSLQLVDASTDRYLWSRTFDRSLQSAISLQSEIATEVATQLPARLNAGGLRSVPVTRDPAAYDLYLRSLLAFRTLYGDSMPADFKATENLLNEAVERDPEFALAYAQRARLHSLMLISSIDLSDANYRSIQRDLEAAHSRAPNDPIVHAARAYFLMADDQIERAHEALQVAEAAGLHSAEWLIPKARILWSLGRTAEAENVDQTMLSLDPGNPLVITFALDDLIRARRIEAVYRITKMSRPNFPQMSDGARDWVRFGMQGDLSAFRAAAGPWLAAMSTQPGGTSSPGFVALSFSILRYEKRYEEIVRMLDAVSEPTVNVVAGIDDQIFGPVGKRPLAEYRAWAYMLLGDRKRAREEGRAVLAFVAKSPETKWNTYFRKLLEAQGYTFTGQKKEAIAAARTALSLKPRSKNAVDWMGVATLSARVLAWNGEGDEATGLLEDLSVATPGLLPASITRDPALTTPLAENARFQSLVARLEEQMRNTQLPR